ncbi:MAG: glutamate--tRNA ligase [Candidatus Kerfeldbacteria bacterium]|nr:glutamate--tRNA ligase [Candidatus Kerfeldbacteria bacterium]
MSPSAAPVRVRIAPSPTGTLHVGTARSALYNYLFARQHGGAFVVRIEDTDAARSTKAHEESILADLAWLGLTWDEGPDIGGAYAPYRQSERSMVYQTHIQALLASGAAYPCTCTKEELAAMRARQAQEKLPPRYDGTCRDRTPEERAAQSGKPFVVRFRTPPHRTLTFDDAIRGPVTFTTDDLDDFVIAQDDGRRALYNFAVVVDDALMKISHVIRGEDHISNTPKQLLLAEAMDFAPPIFAHMPLILDTNRAKLSKRAGPVSVGEYRTEGFLPHALVNYLALLGWNPKSTDEVFTLDELVQRFSLSQVHRGGAVFDRERLHWLNGKYVRMLPLPILDQFALPFYPPQASLHPPEYRQAVLDLVRTRVRRLNELPETTTYFFTEELNLDATLVPWKQQRPDEAGAVLRDVAEAFQGIPDMAFSADRIRAGLEGIVHRTGKKNGEVFWPVRVALTARTQSPGPVEVAVALGKERTIARLQAARILVAEQ